MNQGWAKLHVRLRHQLTSPNTMSRPRPVLTKLGCTQLGNQTRLTDYVETRTRQAPNPLTKTSYEGVCT